MKNRFKLISIIICLLFLIGCSKVEERYTWLNKYEELEQIPSSNSVVIEVGNVDLEVDNQLSVDWENKSNKELMFGKDFTITKKVKGDWVELEYSRDELDFESIGIILGENMTVTETYDLSLFDDKFKQGHYKFISSIIIDKVEYSVESEFIIE